MDTDPAWHATPLAAVLQTLKSGEKGLSETEAARRLAQFGPNHLRPPAPVSALAILRDQFTSVVVYLLGAAVVVSGALGDWAEAVAVTVVLLINTVLGFAMELRARRTMDALLEMNVLRAAVLRDGQLASVDAVVLVRGDIVEISAGHRVPADSRLISATDLRADEAALTGESALVSKAIGEVAADTALAERTNMIYKGTTVASGVARAIVVATGAATELGRIGELVAEIVEERTPLERRLDALGRRLVWIALAIALLVAAVSALQGSPWSLVFQMGIALAVAAVPEALPAVATIALAVGLKRMARRRALVRRLPAVEALGSTTVICTDKTRTLTSGDMTVVRLWIAGRDHNLASSDTATLSSEPLLRRALETGALASRQQAADTVAGARSAGDPVDTAFLAAATRAGIDRLSLLGAVAPTTIPFSSERQFMGSFRRTEAGLIAHVKGAPRRVMELSGRVLTTEGERTLDEDARNALMAINEGFARDGLRVIALATGTATDTSAAAVRDLTFLGLAGLIDPAAPGVRETIDVLRAAGLRTVMLTGDQRLTAETIGRQLGVLGDDGVVVDGRELDGLSDTALVDKVRHAAAFSRISPEHKLDVVRALQSAGHIVAMIGDGVNDAPALKKADVGVAMGIRGTDVAKESASIVLQDDRFETIAAAVEEGRVIYDNIRKFVFYLFSCNLAEILVLLVAGLAGWPIPLLPLQILWLNIVTDTFPALSLVMEPGEKDVMRRPPQRVDEALLTRAFLSQIFLYGILIAAASLGAFAWALWYSPDLATTVSFMTLALAQIFHLATARHSESAPRDGNMLSNGYAVAAAGIAIGLQLIALYVEPLAIILDVGRPGLAEWLVIIGFAAIPALAAYGVSRRRRITNRSFVLKAPVSG